MGLWGESAACSLGKVGRNGELKGSRFGRDQGWLRGSDRRRRRGRRAYDVLQGSVSDHPDAAAPVTSIALMVAQPSKPMWPAHRRFGALAGATDQRPAARVGCGARQTRTVELSTPWLVGHPRHHRRMRVPRLGW